MALIAVLVSVLLAAADQFTKWLAVTYVQPVGSIPVLKIGGTEWINLTYCENTGMSFSLLQGQRFVLIALPVILICVIEWYIFSGRVDTKLKIFSLAAVAGGGLGNLIDRAFLGYVVDFIDFKIINFAIFNFADICVVCGGIAFTVIYMIGNKKSESEKAADDQL